MSDAERLTRLETKMDYLINSFADFREFQSAICKDSKDSRAELLTRVGELEKWRTYLIGGWAVLTAGCAILYDFWKMRKP